MLRKILIAFLIVAAALALYIAGDVLYRYYTPFYKPGYTIMESAYSLNQITKKQLWANESILREMERNLSWLNNRPADSLTYRSIYLKAKALHTAASELTGIFDKTITWGSQETKFLGETGPDGKRKELDIYSDPVPVTYEFAKGIKQALNSFQAQLPDTFYSAQGSLRYKRLRRLTSLSDSEFYNQFYRHKEAYLLVGELAVVKAALLGLEAEQLQTLLKQGKQLVWFREPASRIYLPFTPDVPATIKAGDTAVFTLRLATPFKFNQNPHTVFEFPAGTIDSIKQDAVAYVSFSPGSQKSSSDNFGLNEYKLPATIKFKFPRNQGRDTAFKTDLRVPLKGSKP